ncbi:MAG: glycosyltransferase family 87 protein [Planctomycetota bacterium]|nr:glycosyltransferase family 87 protein [Planctomycetota bacterium]
MTDQPTPWTLRGQLGWGLIALVLCFLFAKPLLDRFRPDRDEVIDFYQEWSSARNLLTGRPIYLPIEKTFEPYLGLQAQDELNWDINVHPPTAVLLAIPLAWMNYYDATVVWNVLSLAALFASLWLLARQLNVPLSPWSALPLVSVLLLANPVWQQVTQGQLNCVLTLLIIGIWVAARQDRHITAGIWLGLATAIKLFPGFLIVYFVLQRQWRAVAATAIAFAAITVATATILGVDAYKTYIADVVPQAVEWKSTWNNASWPGLCAKLFNPANGHTSAVPLVQSQLLEVLATGLGWLVILGGLAVVTWHARSETARDHAFALTVTAMLLLSPVTWEHYFLMLLLPLAMLWKDDRRTFIARCVFVIAFVVLCLPIYAMCNTFIEGGFGEGTATVAQTLTLLSMQCYAMLILFGQGVLRAWSLGESRRPRIAHAQTVTA